MFGISMKIIWLIIAIVFGIAEAMTLGLTMIWFSVGAIFAMGAAFLTDNVFIQILVFALVSVVMLFVFTRKLIKLNRDKNNKFWSTTETNTEAFIDKKGFIIRRITPEESGLAKVKGEEWTAVAADPYETIDKGEEIVVKSIEGVKLVVEKVKK
ncbi:NfeD family protein [Peptostreptococcus anaerobius]|uniref:NfeD family protein n=2 Tax=Peptostreptococcus porci TaxID=2652282 RepID=A0A6N7WY49_9FIRM|nr:NfeD family protein [Peptostreptococcus porci]MDD7183241.1 NfeD family protein [Peptostreptococcus porci]MDY2795186.1 NfeD family protein [Peptostreptococcus porci]MDY4128482.1 NfeD family protein [Peptostreptococcus porci]MDY5963430.1 NfeD family protein [Peptostreptococcus porci]MST61795.1 NfeD family protein [Peptostreptococcus porci]